MLGSNQIGGFEIWATISEDNRQCERLHILHKTTVFYETQGIPDLGEARFPNSLQGHGCMVSREVGDVGWSLQASDGLHPALEYPHQPFRDGSSESRAAVCLLKDEPLAASRGKEMKGEHRKIWGQPTLIPLVQLISDISVDATFFVFEFQFDSLTLKTQTWLFGSLPHVAQLPKQRRLKTAGAFFFFGRKTVLAQPNYPGSLPQCWKWGWKGSGSALSGLDLMEATAAIHG
jgi:hypothetical protein